MFFIFFSDISMNCVLLAKMDQVFSSKSKAIKHTAKVGGGDTTKVGEFCQSGKVGTMLTQKIHSLKREKKRIECFLLKVTLKWLVNRTSCSNQAARLVSIRSCVNIDRYSAT